MQLQHQIIPQRSGVAKAGCPVKSYFILFYLYARVNISVRGSAMCVGDSQGVTLVLETKLGLGPLKEQ